jgi:hypothetical protein
LPIAERKGHQGRIMKKKKFDLELGIEKFEDQLEENLEDMENKMKEKLKSIKKKIKKFKPDSVDNY